MDQRDPIKCENRARKVSSRTGLGFPIVILQARAAIIESPDYGNSPPSHAEIKILLAQNQQ